MTEEITKPAPVDKARDLADQIKSLLTDFNHPFFLIIPTQVESNSEIACVTYSNVCEACIFAFIASWYLSSGISHLHEGGEEIPLNDSKSEIRH